MHLVLSRMEPGYNYLSDYLSEPSIRYLTHGHAALPLRAQGFGERKGFSTASPVYVKSKQHKPRHMNSSLVRTHFLAQ
jgi:hypothetical protein